MGSRGLFPFQAHFQVDFSALRKYACEYEYEYSWSYNTPLPRLLTNRRVRQSQARKGM